MVNFNDIANTPFMVGQKAMNSKDFNLAIEKFSICIDENPSCYMSLTFRGTAKLKIAIDIDGICDAIADFTNAINVKDDYYSSYYERGLAYLRLDKPYLSINDFSSAIKLLPNNYYCYLQRGISYFQNNQFEKALEDINIFMENVPGISSNLSGYEKRAEVFVKLKDYKNAVQDYSKLLQYPMNRKSDLYFRRGRAYFNLENYEEALNDFNLATELNSKNQEASAYKILIKEINSFNNNGRKTIINIIRCYFKLNNKKIERTIGDFIRSLLELLENDEYDKMENESCEFIRIYPNCFIGYVFRSVVFGERKDYESAKKYINISLSLNPGNEISLNLLNVFKYH